MLATPSVLAATDGNLGIGLAAIIVLGVGAQWLGSRIRVPSVLLLLAFGVLAGPVAGVVEPDELLGDLLFPAVSLAVGVLLFEGGLSLRFSELERHGRGPILRLVTIGVLVTWVIGSIAAFAVLDLDRDGAVLLASILVVTGPTVVLPLLKFARVREPVNGILRWEGIFIDPVGATLAIVVLDVILGTQGSGSSFSRILTTAAAGSLAGLAGAALITVMFRRHWVPDHLHNPFTLAVMVAAFAGADAIQAEAGLFATTVMGVALANQRWAPIAHIREFEENLGSLILAGLFIVLGARIDLDQVVEFLPQGLLFAAILILVARPAAVYLSTVGSGLSFVERAYLVCMSPRGIVAASVSALFGLEMEEAGTPVDALVPVTFIVIVTTVVFSAIAARVGAARFRVARPSPTGVAFVGGPPWVIRLAGWLSDREIPVLVITTDPLEAVAASRNGVFTYTGNMDSDDLLVAIDTVGIRTAVAVSRFHEMNSLVIDRLAEHIGRANVYELPRSDEHTEAESATSAVMARRPFGKARTQLELEALTASDYRFHGIGEGDDLPDEADSAALLRLGPDGPTILASTPDRPPAAGSTLVYLVAGPTPDPSEPGPVTAP